MKEDKRNYLYVYYARFLKRYKPGYFVFENVLGLLSASDQNGSLYIDAMKNKFGDAGYETAVKAVKVLSANDYGVLQKCKRVILLKNKNHG